VQQKTDYGNKIQISAADIVHWLQGGNNEPCQDDVGK
jgi:hypothetical protein